MLTWLYGALRLDLARTGLTAAAVAAVVAVILVLEGFNEGLLRQLRETVARRGGDLILCQAGVANMTVARSVLPQYTRLEVEEIEGVAAAHPLTAIYVIYEQDGTRTPVFLIVYDTAGGPHDFVAGGPASAPREIVVDRSLTRKYGLEVGDALVVTGYPFKISGITRDDASMFSPLGFVRFDDLIDFYLESDLATDITTFPLLSFLLIDLQQGADAAVVAARIESDLPDVDAFTVDQLAANDEAVGRMLFGPIFKLLIGIGYVIGALVVGIIMFAAVSARRRELGVLMALGFRLRFIGLAVLMEAAFLAVVALPLGVLLAAVVGAGIEAMMPLYEILVVEPAPLARTGAACLSFAIVGGLAPLLRLRKIDPCLVFRGG